MWVTDSHKNVVLVHIHTVSYTHLDVYKRQVYVYVENVGATEDNDYIL